MLKKCVKKNALRKKERERKRVREREREVEIGKERERGGREGIKVKVMPIRKIREGEREGKSKNNTFLKIWKLGEIDR